MHDLESCVIVFESVVGWPSPAAGDLCVLSLRWAGALTMEKCSEPNADKIVRDISTAIRRSICVETYIPLAPLEITVLMPLLVLWNNVRCSDMNPLITHVFRVKTQSKRKRQWHQNIN